MSSSYCMKVFYVESTCDENLEGREFVELFALRVACVERSAICWSVLCLLNCNTSSSDIVISIIIYI